MDEPIKKIYIYIHTHTMEYYSAVKEKAILPFATWMELKGIILSEMSDKDKHCIVSQLIMKF